MRIHCKACGEIVSLENINLATSVATCGACDLVFSAESQLSNPNQAPASIPDSITIEESETKLIIKKRWSGPVAMFFWLGLTAILFFGGGGITLLFAPLSSPSYLLPFDIVIRLIMFNLYYFPLRFAFNSTYFTVEHDSLRIKSGPLPWFGNKRIPLREIEQLYVTRHVDHKNRKSFRLRALLNSQSPLIPPEQQTTLSKIRSMLRGKSPKLAPNVLSLDETRFIEAKIEEFLHIDNAEVDGEYLDE